MTKIVEHKAEYIYQCNTDTKFMDGYPEIIKSIVGWFLKKVWAYKIAKMNDKQIYDEYYRLTRLAIDDSDDGYVRW